MADQTLEIVLPTGTNPVTLNLSAYGASSYTADSPITFNEDGTNLGVFRATRSAVTSSGPFTGLDNQGNMWHFGLLNVTDTYFGDFKRITPNLLNPTGIVPANVKQINDSATAAAIEALMYAALENGTAQAGGASSITLRAGASAEDDIFVKQAVWIIGGTGVGQSNDATAYNGTSKLLTVFSPWEVEPDNTSYYVLLGRVR